MNDLAASARQVCKSVSPRSLISAPQRRRFHGSFNLMISRAASTMAAAPSLVVSLFIVVWAGKASPRVVNRRRRRRRLRWRWSRHFSANSIEQLLLLLLRPFELSSFKLGTLIKAACEGSIQFCDADQRPRADKFRSAAEATSARANRISS